MLELLVFAGAVAAAQPPKAEPPPPLELLEFIGEWSEAEAARFIDRENQARKVSDERREPPEKNDEN